MSLRWRSDNLQIRNAEDRLDKAGRTGHAKTDIRGLHLTRQSGRIEQVFRGNLHRGIHSIPDCSVLACGQTVRYIFGAVAQNMHIGKNILVGEDLTFRHSGRAFEPESSALIKVAGLTSNFSKDAGPRLKSPAGVTVMESLGRPKTVGYGAYGQKVYLGNSPFIPARS